MATMETKEIKLIVDKRRFSVGFIKLIPIHKPSQRSEAYKDYFNSRLNKK